MKRHDEMTERELLVRIDERTAHLPDLTKKVNKHELVLAVIIVILIFVTAKTYPWVTDVFARVLG